MPGMGGEELCRRLHADDTRPLPMLVMTSMTARDQRSWAQELGGIEFLEKPVSPRRIATLLANCSARRSTMPDSDTRSSPATGAGSSAAWARLHGGHRQ
jgi:CheY-like chemotaxis protein